ncbi:nucleotidyltransferase family protein [Cellulomonas humilata]|uniref:CTP:molybdopterin cytidylyltransferase MocA n=1 Tax=Cellulomonas humilata TaxID=144055 RepID=A0ABU0EFG9_9CELL|nr:nucleotidyltransferase family protein [Cellulomonas humilata]MDQ0374021.1 CTP:molybdopterin cytidylyltransferase MocA [Cellulomonas humilata]
MPPTDASLSGIVLAAGAGTRHGGPKALVVPWLADAVRLLLDGGCARVVVVLGAAADEARSLVPDDARVTTVVARQWADGLGESLRTGLAHAAGDAVVVTLVDLPGTPVSVVERLAATWDRHTLRQAVYDGRPGHPVLIGADHWAPLSDTLTGDRGARGYLVAHGVVEVECGDLHDGLDEDVSRTADPPRHAPTAPTPGGPS